MEFRTLGRTGLVVSKLGFGASPLGNEFGEMDAGEGERAVHCAIDLGINYFDTAPYYGRTLAETRLGAALEGRRDKVVLATKCGRYDVNQFDFSAARIRASIDESLTRLRTDYLDVFIAHDVEFVSRAQIVEQAIPTMRELQRLGKTRFIGISGLQLNMLREVAEAAPVDVILSYCRYNLLTTDMDELLTPFVREHGIGLINASPLAMGMLTREGPPAWHPAPLELKEAARKISERFPVSAVGLQFCLQHPYVGTTLSGISSVAQVKENVAAAMAAPNFEMMDEIRRMAAAVENRWWPTGLRENQDHGS